MAKKDKKTAKAEKNDDGTTKLEFKKLDEYVPGVSGSGKRTKNNGDAVATALNGLTLDEVEQLAGRLKVELPDYSHLNVGMQRMNYGNKIRKAVNALNKEEAGSGDEALEDKGRTIRVKADKRIAKEADAKAVKAAAAAAKEEAA